MRQNSLFWRKTLICTDAITQKLKNFCEFVAWPISLFYLNGISTPVGVLLAHSIAHSPSSKLFEASLTSNILELDYMTLLVLQTSVGSGLPMFWYPRSHGPENACLKATMPLCIPS